MTSESEKGIVEIGIFKRFAEAAGLNCASVEKQSPEEGKPDLRCLIEDEVIYFELTEACSEDVVKAIVNAQDIDSLHTSVKDYTSLTYRKKINKHYAVTEPIELLIYNTGRTLLSDAILIDNIKAISKHEKGPFRKIWYFGENAREL
jgi:hypothetical protein